MVACAVRPRGVRAKSVAVRQRARVLVAIDGPAGAGKSTVARKVAERFNLRFEEVKGSDDLIYRTIFGPWDDDFVVAQPGQTIQYTDFKTSATSTNNLNAFSLTLPKRKESDG